MVQILFGGAAGVLAVLQYGPYMRDILKGKTRPHAFSWFVWGIPAAIVFLAQVLEGGGVGAWATGITALLCTGIFFLSLRYGEPSITMFDWLCLGGSLLATALWAITKEPLGAVLLVTASDLLAFGPTIRKSFAKPNEETLNTYVTSGIKWSLSVFALASFNPVTLTYPIAMIFGNWGFAVFLAYRRSFSAPTF
jgi:hypothetical protein